MCVTHLHGVYCDGVFPYLLVMANFVYMWEVYCFDVTAFVRAFVRVELA